MKAAKRIQERRQYHCWPGGLTINHTTENPIRIVLLLVLVLGLLSAGAATGASCARAFTSLQLTGHDPLSEQSFFVATESNGGDFTVLRGGDNCTPGEETRVWYSVMPGTTVPGDTSLAPRGPVTLYAPTDSESGPNSAEVDIDVTGEINGVERATVSIDEAQHSGMDQPFYILKSSPVYVLDTDGPAEVAMGRAEMRANEGTTVRIPVFRTGPVSGSDSIDFEIEELDAEASDYGPPATSTVSFGGSTRVGVIAIRLSTDRREEGDESLKVKLTGEGAGSQSETLVTIADRTVSELRPKGRLHHPKHRFKYPQNYPWLNEIHIFTSSQTDAEVNKAQLAIRKRKKSGSCAWWRGDGFKQGSCTQVRWFGKGIKNPSDDYFKYRIGGRLPLSVGTSVDNYKIWGRWYDRAGRVSRLRKGRNLNEFEVIKPTAACRNNPFNFRKCKPVRP